MKRVGLHNISAYLIGYADIPPNKPVSFRILTVERFIIMKIVFYTNVSLFHDLGIYWSARLRHLGHESELITVRRDWPTALPFVRGADVNFFLCGFSILQILNRHGWPQSGRNIAWMFEPLADCTTASWHGFKSTIFKEAATHLNGVIGMDSLVDSFVSRYTPNLLHCVIPYTPPREKVRKPTFDSKNIDVLWLARTPPGRRQLILPMLQREVPGLVHVGGGALGDTPDVTIARSRISLQIHSDDFRYFDQYRIFYAWANGSVVVAEPSLNQHEWGAVNGEHLIVAESAEIPAVCHELLADSSRQAAIAANARQLLMETLLPELWEPRFLAFLYAVSG